VSQIRRPSEDRDWHGRMLGFPYDFRMPTLNRVQERLWNPDDPRVIVPTVVGIGWTFNLYQVARQLGLIKS
jgi:hypothetical protein